MSNAGAGDPALRPLAGGRLLSEITNRIVAFVREHYGRGPIRAKTYVLDNLIVCVLSDGGPRASVEVFDDLVGSRPLLRRNDQVDIAPPEPIERAIRDATRIQTHRSELIAPRQRRLLVLERSDRLPAVEARIADRHGRFLGDAALHEARERHRQSVAVRSRRSAGR